MSCNSSAVEQPVIQLNHYSSFARFQHIAAWILRFVNDCQGPRITPLTLIAEKYWACVIQEGNFSSDIADLKTNHSLSNNSSLHPFIDSDGLLRVGGRESNSDLSYQRMHPLIVHCNYVITKLIICLEHAACRTHTIVFHTLQSFSHTLHEENCTLYYATVYYLSSSHMQTSEPAVGSIAHGKCDAWFYFSEGWSGLCQSGEDQVWYGS